MVAKKIKRTPNPNHKYATQAQVKAAAKLALAVHGPAFRELAKR